MTWRTMAALGFAASAHWLFAAEPSAALLTTAREVRAVTVEAAESRIPARIRGVITFHEPETGLTYLQDETAGVGISAGAPSRLPAELRVGDWLEVDGAVAPGNYAPVVAGKDGAAPLVKVLGAAVLPTPLPASVGELLGGANDGYWVELHGTVRAVQVRPFTPDGDDGREAASAVRSRPPAVRLSVELGTDAGRFVLVIPWKPGVPAPEGLMDARVRVRGVLGSIVNRWRQWVGLLLYVPSLGELQVERPSSTDPFSLPVRRVDEIMRFSAGMPGEDRVRVRGVVTLVQPGYRLFLRSDAGPLEVQTAQSLSGLDPGTEVDVVGYPTLAAKRAFLHDSRLKVLARHPAPEPLELSRSEVMARYADSELVRLTGRLFQNALRGAYRVLVLEAEGQFIEAKFVTTLGTKADQRMGAIRPGAELAVAGIAQVSGAADWGGGVRPYAVNLLVRDAADITVLLEPPWWTPARLLAAVGALALLLLIGAGWVVLLRRRVSAQTHVIREQAQREANERERRRIAQDIHDDLGSRLTQLALLGARVQAAGDATAITMELGTRISATARATVQTMDEIVWAVNPGNDTLQSLGDYLCKVATSLLAEAEIACQLEVPAVLPAHRLSAEQRHNLVLAVREALHNVVKHSRARTAGLVWRLDGGRLEITIWDAGAGIAAVGAGRGQGLGNLRRRMHEIGGECEIGPSPGGGTRVVLSLILAPP